jgi:glycosyltransferase involved in cell wall biosynthesis
MQQRELIIFMPSIEGGGVEKNLFIIANYLSKKIKNIILITASRKYNNKFKNIKIINPTVRLENLKGRKLKYILCIIELLKFLIKSDKYVLFAFQANLYCALISIFFPNLKIITRSNSSPSGWAKNYFKKFIFKYLFKRINKVIVNSLSLKKELKQKFNVNSECIYNPLNKKDIIKLSKKKLNFSFFNTSKLKIINIGRLVEQKDQLTFLKSLNILKSKISFRAVIMGSGKKKQELLNYISENDLKKFVKIINFQNNPYTFIRKSDLLVHTAIFEGLPNVLLEAISLNKYVISTNCPTGPSEILSNGKGGDLVKMKDYLKISEKLENYSKNKISFKKKIVFSKINLERFNFRKNLKKYLKVTNDYLNKS